MVDTKNRGQETYDALMTQIRTVSDKPVKYAVVGDVHQDKSGNTEFSLLPEPRYAHENELTGLETYTNAAGTPGPPNVTYSTDYSIQLDGQEAAHVCHFGKASTGGDSITYFPDLKVVVMGDGYRNGINCDYAQGGSILEWPKTLESVLELDIDMVIPNRGDPVTRAELEATRDRLIGISNTAIELVKNGTPKEELVEKIDATDPSYQVARMLFNQQARLDTFYDEVSEAAAQ